MILSKLSTILRKINKEEEYVKSVKTSKGETVTVHISKCYMSEDFSYEVFYDDPDFGAYYENKNLEKLIKKLNKCLGFK